LYSKIVGKKRVLGENEEQKTREQRKRNSNFQVADSTLVEKREGVGKMEGGNGTRTAKASRAQEGGE